MPVNNYDYYVAQFRKGVLTPSQLRDALEDLNYVTTESGAIALVQQYLGSTAIVDEVNLNSVPTAVANALQSEGVTDAKPTNYDNPIQGVDGLHDDVWGAEDDTQKFDYDTYDTIFEALEGMQDDIDTVITGEIADGAVTTPKLANSAVTSTKISNSGIITDNLANGAVTSDKIADSTITTADLADSAVTSAKISNSGIVTDNLADVSVTSAKLGDSAVTSAKISNSGIVTNNLADGSVTTDKIFDGTIDTLDLANSAVTSAKISNSGIVADNLATDSVESLKIKNSAVTSAKISNSGIVTDNLVDNAVTGPKAGIVAKAAYTGAAAFSIGGSCSVTGTFTIKTNMFEAVSQMGGICSKTCLELDVDNCLDNYFTFS